MLSFSEHNSGFSSDDEKEEDDLDSDFDTDIETDIESEEDKPVACVKDVESKREMPEESDNPKMSQRPASVSNSELRLVISNCLNTISASLWLKSVNIERTLNMVLD